jgi:hypothetical protein
MLPYILLIHLSVFFLIVMCISQVEDIVQKSIHEVDNPAISAVTCTPGMEHIFDMSTVYSSWF